MQPSDEFTGRLEAPETVDIRARVAGTIEQVHFRDGQDVRRGDPLYSIDARPFEAELARQEAQLQSARSQAELAATEAARAQKLLDLKGISQQEFDQLTAGRRNADAAVRAAEAAVAAARLNASYTRISAPIAGRISRTNLVAGNMTGAGDTVLTTLVSVDRIYAYFDASESIFLRFNKASGAKVVEMGLTDESGFPHRGVVDFIDNRLNPQTGSIRMRAVFDNAARRYTPGLIVRIKLEGGVPVPTTLVPDRAIGTDQAKRFVLVVGADNIAQFREVQLGALYDGMRVVTAGVKPGETLIVNGLQRARPGAPVTPQRLEVDGRGMPIEPAAPAKPPAKSDAKS